MAKDASNIAAARTANHLTKELRSYLREAGLPDHHAQGNKVVYDPDNDEFRAVPNNAAMKMSYEGDGESPPTAALTTFWNHVNVSKVHRENLFQACRDVGLV